MFGSGILDTVIGLIFVFLLVSMFVTIVNEIIAAALSSRAKWLRLGIERMIGDTWMQKVYDHPLIAGTVRKDSALLGDPGPSYIPSRSFANVLMSLVHEHAGEIAACQQALRAALEQAAAVGATADDLRREMATAAAAMREKGGAGAAIAGDLARRLGAAPVPMPDMRGRLNDLESRIGALRKDGRTDIAPLLDELGAIDKRLQGPYTVGDAYADIRWFIDGIPARYVREMIQALPDDKLRKTLLTLYDDAGHDVERLKENIEVWFNNGMDRVNGWYKRRSQRVIGALSLVAAVALNADAILIFRYLQVNTDARDAMVAQATQFMENNAAPSAGVVTAARLEPCSAGVAPARLNSPCIVSVDTGRGGAALNDSADANKALILMSPSAATSAPDLLQQIDTVQNKLMDLSIPIGWVASKDAVDGKNGGQVRPRADHIVNDSLQRLGQHWLGWLLTALAATLGAPFWFDMLNRVISIRAAGKAPEEQPKPPKAVQVPVEPGQSPQEAERLRQGDGGRRR
jgi:hypothetical protein